ncbi:hypothetical protein TB1_032214 [Malus domestica]
MVDESKSVSPPFKKLKLDSDGPSWNHFVNWSPKTLFTTQPSSTCKKLGTAHCLRSSLTTPAIQDYILS